MALEATSSRVGSRTRSLSEPTARFLYRPDEVAGSNHYVLIEALLARGRLDEVTFASVGAARGSFHG